MNWTELLKKEVAATYQVTEGLIDLVREDDFGWKPPLGENWMTVGQLLMHITDACGACFRGFVTGEWGAPEGAGDGPPPDDAAPEGMFPPAERYPSVESIAKARELLAADKALAYRMIDEAGEEGLATRRVTAPWNPAEEYFLGHRLLQMTQHLGLHKSQLFYYLKLLGRPVNTTHLWGG